MKYNKISLLERVSRYNSHATIIAKSIMHLRLDRPFDFKRLNLPYTNNKYMPFSMRKNHVNYRRRNDLAHISPNTFFNNNLLVISDYDKEITLWSESFAPYVSDNDEY